MDPPGLHGLTEAIGANVRHLREASGITQAALAEICGIEPAHMQRVEYGSTSPSLRLLQRIANHFETEVWKLCKPGREPNPKRRPGRPKGRT